MSEKAIASAMNITYRLARTDQEKYAALALRRQLHPPPTDTQQRLLEECRDNCCFLVIATHGAQIIALTRMYEHPVYLPQGIMLDCLTVDRLFYQPAVMSGLIGYAMREAAVRGYTACYASICCAQGLLVVQNLGFTVENPRAKLPGIWLAMKPLVKPNTLD